MVVHGTTVQILHSSGQKSHTALNPPGEELQDDKPLIEQYRLGAIGVEKHAVEANTLHVDAGTVRRHREHNQVGPLAASNTHFHLQLVIILMTLFHMEILAIKSQTEIFPCAAKNFNWLVGDWTLDLQNTD